MNHEEHYEFFNISLSDHCALLSVRCDPAFNFLRHPVCRHEGHDELRRALRIFQIFLLVIVVPFLVFVVTLHSISYVTPVCRHKEQQSAVRIFEYQLVIRNSVQ